DVLHRVEVFEMSWPATAGHPGDERYNPRADARWLGGPVEPGHDNFGGQKPSCLIEHEGFPFVHIRSLGVLDLVGRGNTERPELRFLAAISLARDAVQLPGDIVAGDSDDRVAA